jgi:hypothetical protein
MEDRKAMKVERVILPNHEEETLQDQDDIIIWTKFNILLQAVDELTAEYGHAGDATRQLRIVTQEAVRRGMFEARTTLGEPTDAHLWTWYEVLKQLLVGESEGKWEKIGDTNREYTIVVKALLERGHKMPRQHIDLEALDLLGEIIT